MDETTLLVIVDVNKGEHTECPELIELAQSIVVIDHHRQASVMRLQKPYCFILNPMHRQRVKWWQRSVSILAAD